MGWCIQMWSLWEWLGWCCNATHSSTLAWKIQWMEEPGRLQSMGSLRVRHDWATSLSLSCIGEGNGNLLQCSCLENPRDGGAWWAAVYGVAQSWTRLKWLSSSSQYICLENTMDRGAWWAAVLGVAQSRTWLKWLSSNFSSLSLFITSAFNTSLGNRTDIRHSLYVMIHSNNLLPSFLTDLPSLTSYGRSIKRKL